MGTAFLVTILITISVMMLVVCVFGGKGIDDALKGLALICSIVFLIIAGRLIGTNKQRYSTSKYNLKTEIKIETTVTGQETSRDTIYTFTAKQ